MLANALTLASDKSLTDDMVISRVLRGQTDEYEILIRRYNQQLYKSARGILHDESDIEDIMQETYLRGFEKLHQFRSEARFSTWLTRILINCALQHVNKLKSRDRLRLDLPESEELQLEDQAGEEVSAGLRKALEAAIDHLPSKYRIVFVLREIEHMPVIDTASVLGLSEENVKVRLHRAKNMLRSLLKSKIESLDIFEFHASRCSQMADLVMTQIKQLGAPAIGRP